MLIFRSGALLSGCVILCTASLLATLCVAVGGTPDGLLYAALMFGCVTLVASGFVVLGIKFHDEAVTEGNTIPQDDWLLIKVLLAVVLCSTAALAVFAACLVHEFAHNEKLRAVEASAGMAWMVSTLLAWALLVGGNKEERLLQSWSMASGLLLLYSYPLPAWLLYMDMVQPWVPVSVIVCQVFVLTPVTIYKAEPRANWARVPKPAPEPPAAPPAPEPAADTEAAA